MRAKLFFFVVCILTGILGGYAWSTQRALPSARVVYFKIEPVDPRALLVGDYMRLSYDFEGERWEKKQQLTLYAEPNGVARKEGPGEPLHIKAHNRTYRVPHQYYFEEGTGTKYENAAYAKAAVLPNGAILILNLTDEKFNVL